MKLCRGTLEKGERLFTRHYITHDNPACLVHLTVVRLDTKDPTYIFDEDLLCLNIAGKHSLKTKSHA